ncbi:MAG: YggT family protein [Nitrospinota bacterium]
MFILGNFIVAVSYIVDIVLVIYIWMVIISVCLPLLGADPYNQIVSFIYALTNPVLNIVRKYIPPISNIDISPFIIILAIYFFRHFLVGSMFQIGAQLKSGF